MWIKLLLSITLATLLLTLSGVAVAVMLNQDDITTLQQVAEACRRDRDQDGFGNVTLTSVNFQNTTANIDAPCKLHLHPGSTLQMNQVTLTSKNLLIDSIVGDEHTTATHINFNNVHFDGNNAGMQVTLKDPASTVSIQNSSFTYSLSYGIAVGSGDTDTSSHLEFLRNDVTTTSQAGEGINLVSTGSAIYKDNSFHLADPEDFALLLGNSCELTNNLHANERCEGP